MKSMLIDAGFSPCQCVVKTRSKDGIPRNRVAVLHRPNDPQAPSAYRCEGCGVVFSTRKVGINRSWPPTHKWVPVSGVETLIGIPVADRVVSTCTRRILR